MVSGVLLVSAVRKDRHNKADQHSCNKNQSLLYSCTDAGVRNSPEVNISHKDHCLIEDSNVDLIFQACHKISAQIIHQYNLLHEASAAARDRRLWLSFLFVAVDQANKIPDETIRNRNGQVILLDLPAIVGLREYA